MNQLLGFLLLVAVAMPFALGYVTRENAVPCPEPDPAASLAVEIEHQWQMLELQKARDGYARQSAEDALNLQRAQASLDRHNAVSSAILILAGTAAACMVSVTGYGIGMSLRRSRSKANNAAPPNEGVFWGRRSQAPYTNGVHAPSPNGEDRRVNWHT